MAELKPPISKYKLTVVIEGNIISEVEDELLVVANSFWHDIHRNGESRDEMSIVGGRSSRTLQHTNPEQTPEDYREQLKVWAQARRFIRASSIPESATTEEKK